MLGGLGNMLSMLKNAKEIQANIKRMQEELAGRTFEADAGGGLVKAVVNGKTELIDVKLEPSALKPEDAELLEDMIKAAVRSATLKAQEAAKQEVAKLTGGLPLPGISELMSPES